MLQQSRRNLILSAAGAATAFGLSRQMTFIDAALAQNAPGVGKGFKSFKVGGIDVTMLYDGKVDRPNVAGFVKNASIDDVKGALTASGLPTDNVPNLFTIPVARMGGRIVLFDAGTGGQVGPGTGEMAANMKAAGIDPSAVNVVLVSHFHPDHIFGLMDKDTNAPLYPNAQLVMPEVEYNWWTDAAVFNTLPAARHGLAKRIQAVFPNWKSTGRIRLVGDDVEVLPGVRSVFAPGHTPGHTAWHVSSANAQLMVLADTVVFDPVFLRHPDWHPSFDADGATAEKSRRKLIERVIAEKMMMTAYHFVFPSAGMLAKDGDGYAFSPVA
jgi:glyoxylase-like metal-dependent hydrolase (beta-lactamase superfamily II)